MSPASKRNMRNSLKKIIRPRGHGHAASGHSRPTTNRPPGPNPACLSLTPCQAKADVLPNFFEDRRYPVTWLLLTSSTTIGIDKTKASNQYGGCSCCCSH